MVESTDKCTCKLLDTRAEYERAIAPFDGKTNDQIKALYIENKEFNDAVQTQQIMYDMCDLPPLVITGTMFN